MKVLHKIVNAGKKATKKLEARDYSAAKNGKCCGCDPYDEMFRI